MINKFKNKIEKIQNKPEETKTRIIWVLMSLCIIVIAGVWYINLKFSSNTFYNNAKPLFFSFKNFPKEIGDIGKINDNYKTAVNNIIVKGEKKKIEEIVKNYIKKNNYLEGAKFSDLHLKNIEKLQNNNWYIEYEQYHNGLLVNGSKISFIIDEAKEKVTSSKSNFDPGINFNIIEPKISEKEAFDLITKNLKNSNPSLNNLNQKSSQLVFYKNLNKNSAKYNLAWKINVFSLKPAYNYIYFVNAENNKIISKVNF